MIFCTFIWKFDKTLLLLQVTCFIWYVWNHDDNKVLLYIQPFFINHCAYELSVRKLAPTLYFYVSIILILAVGRSPGTPGQEMGLFKLTCV